MMFTSVEVEVEAAAAYCKSVNDDCLCQRTNPGTPVGEHIYCFCGCHIHDAFLAGYAHALKTQNVAYELQNAKCEKLVEALEFYKKLGPAMACGECIPDGGDVAREALREFRGE